MSAPKTHGMSRTKFYAIWSSMRERCDTPSTTSYPIYGGRGISYDPSWKSFETFYEDMYESYQPGLSLERIDNNGNYSKSNCKWVTRVEQSNNRRSSRYFEINGVKKTLAQWSAQSSLNPSTIRQRIYGLNWPVEKALEVPARERKLSR